MEHAGVFFPGAATQQLQQQIKANLKDADAAKSR